MSEAASIRMDNGRAACRLWLANCPRYLGLATACVGEFRCDDADAGRALLDDAIERLARMGFEYVIGPMDGDTWHPYRLVVDSDGSAPFPLEPSNPIWHVGAFADFETVARYTSARADTWRQRDLAAYARRVHDAGIRVRSFDRTRAEADLRAIYRLSAATFERNFLYTPISEAAFMELYRPLVERVDPRLILMAEDDSLQAFLFAYVNARTAIVKTYASQRPGLGAYLIEQFQAGPAAGCDAIVHALMHEDNISQNNSRKSARTFRRYALYGKRL